MHQSVKDYIEQRNLPQRLSPELHTTSAAIGHGSCFLFKSRFTFLAMSLTSARIGVKIQLLLEHGQEAELSTGASQTAFIDSIDSM